MFSIIHSLFFQLLLIFHFCEWLGSLFVLLSKFAERNFNFILDFFGVHLINNILPISVELWRKNLVDMIDL